MTAELAADEEDWYAVDGRAGRALVARLERRGAFPGSALQTDAFGPDGAVGTDIPNDGIDGPPNVAGAERPVEARTTAVDVDVMETNRTYHVRVSESRYNETDGDEIYRYDLTVRTETLDTYDPNENGATATAAGTTANSATGRTPPTRPTERSDDETPPHIPRFVLPTRTSETGARPNSRTVSIRFL